jgi:glycosyltransferase involved in cell wall biosynthesis
MKVLISTYFRLDPSVGGTVNIIVDTGVKLTEHGVDVRLLTGDRKRFPPPGKVGSFAQIARVDVVHNYGIWVPFSHGVAAAARCFRTPRVLSPIGALAPWALSHRGRKKRIAMQLYQRRDIDSAAVLHATSLTEANHLRMLGVRAPIALIPHGIEVPDELAIARPKSRDDQPRTMLFLSRIHPVKGLLEWVEAWARVRPKGWRMIVAGPDESGHRAEVQACIARHGLTDLFSFTGPVATDAKHRLYKTADVFVLPSFTENFGLVAAEALSYGVPVLTTRGTQWSELAETASGWWVEPGTDGLADGLDQLARLSPEVLRAMGRNGRKLVVERYRWDAVVDKHKALYAWVAGNAAKPGFVEA